MILAQFEGLRSTYRTPITIIFTNSPMSRKGLFALQGRSGDWRFGDFSNLKCLQFPYWISWPIVDVETDIFDAEREVLQQNRSSTWKLCSFSLSTPQPSTPWRAVCALDKMGSKGWIAESCHTYWSKALYRGNDHTCMSDLLDILSCESW